MQTYDSDVTVHRVFKHDNLRDRYKRKKLITSNINKIKLRYHGIKTMRNKCGDFMQTFTAMFYTHYIENRPLCLILVHCLWSKGLRYF